VSYEVSAVVKKRYNKRSKSIEYLLRWKGYGAEHDQWFPEIKLEHCQDLVKDYEMATGNTEWKSRFLSNAESSVVDVELSVASPVPESTVTVPTVDNEPTNESADIVEPHFDPILDLSQSEIPSISAAQGNPLDAPAKGPVTLRRRSTRLQSKA